MASDGLPLRREHARSLRLSVLDTAPASSDGDCDALDITIPQPSTPSHFHSTSGSARPASFHMSPSARSPSSMRGAAGDPVTPRLHHSPPDSQLSAVEPPMTPDEVDALFALLDQDHDGRVTRADMQRALTAEATAISMEHGSATVAHVLHHLWRPEPGGVEECPGSDHVDRGGFGELVQQWKLPTQTSVTEALDAQSRVYESQLPLGRRLLAHWSVEGPMSTFVMAFVGLQIALGVYYFVDLAKDPRIHVLGWGLAFAKLGAGVLYPSLAFVLLSSSRRLATFLRQWRLLSRFINWDRSQYFHAFLGFTILFFALLHALAHLSGTFVRAVDADRTLLPNFPSSPITYRAMVATRAGVTGILALTTLFALCLTGLPSVRRSRFQLFQYTHLLIWPFIALLLVHGTGDLIQSPVLGYWLIVPMLAVLWDRVPRTVSMFRIKPGCSFRVIEDSTVVLSIPQSAVSWTYKPGQYILLRVPELSRLQWHPFTIVGSTSSSGDDALACEVYIRKAGDWTGALLKRTQEALPCTVTVDGPFGSPCDQLSNYARIVIVGTGIGVTPYAGWLRDLGPGQTVDFHWVVKERVSFTWFAALLNAFHFRADAQSDPQLASKGTVSVHTYVTGRAPSDPVQYASRLLLERHRTITHTSSFITGLECETRYGRPDIAKIFQTAKREGARPPMLRPGQEDDKATARVPADGEQPEAITVAVGEKETEWENNSGEDGDGGRSSHGRIGVFFCGPNYLGMEISDRCRMEREKSGISWEFVGEVF